MGKKVNDIWLSAAEKSNINISIDGLEPLTHINFLNNEPAILYCAY